MSAPPRDRGSDQRRDDSVPRVEGAAREITSPNAGARDVLLDDLVRRTQELEAIFEAHADPLIIFDIGGKVVRVNPAARELYGLEVGGTWNSPGRMEARAPIDESGAPVRFEDLPSQRSLRGELVRGFVLGLLSPRGRVWVSASTAPLRGSDGSIVGTVGTAVEITAHRNLMEERERVIRALTHEARTTLNVIRTHGELLGRAPVDEPDARRRAEKIVSSARKLAEIIDALVEGR